MSTNPVGFVGGEYTGEPGDAAPVPSVEMTPAEEIEAIITPVSFAALVASRPDRGPERIGGVLRAGGLGSLNSNSKAKKSWATGGLAAAVCTGTPWFGCPVVKGRVLIIDGELTRGT